MKVPLLLSQEKSLLNPYNIFSSDKQHENNCTCFSYKDTNHITTPTIMSLRFRTISGLTFVSDIKKRYFVKNNNFM